MKAKILDANNRLRTVPKSPFVIDAPRQFESLEVGFDSPKLDALTIFQVCHHSYGDEQQASLSALVLDWLNLKFPNKRTACETKFKIYAGMLTAPVLRYKITLVFRLFPLLTAVWIR